MWWILIVSSLPENCFIFHCCSGLEIHLHRSPRAVCVVLVSVAHHGKERKERRGGRLGRKNAVEADPPGGPEVSLILWESQQGNTETTDDTVSFLLPLNGSVIEVLSYWAGYRTGEKEKKPNLCKRPGLFRWYFYVWAGWYVVISTSPPCQLEERIF